MRKKPYLCITAAGCTFFFHESLIKKMNTENTFRLYSTFGLGWLSSEDYRVVNTGSSSQGQQNKTSFPTNENTSGWMATWKRLPWQAIIVVFAALFLIRNIMTSLAADDYSYAFIWDGEHWGNLMDGIGERQRVENCHDIFVSLGSHYFTWGGRIPSMFFVQLFVWMGKGWFNIANTLVYVLLMLVLYWMAAGRIESPARHKGCLLWILMSMLIGVADYPSTMLWLTGACVYLWTALWQCLFLLPYVLAFRSSPQCTNAQSPNLPNDQTTKRLNIFIIPFGLLAGWSEEAGSLLTVLLTAALLFVLHRQGRMERWMKLGFAALLAGSLLLLLCPGSLHRLQLMQQLAPEYVMPSEMLWSAQMFWNHFTDSFLPILAMECVLLLPIIAVCRRKQQNTHSPKRPNTQTKILLFTVAGLLVPVAMMFSPEFPLRAGFHSTVFLTVASAAAIRALKPPTPDTHYPAPWLVAVGSIVAAYCTFVVVGSLYIEQSIFHQNLQRMALIEQKRSEELIVVPALHIPHRLDRFVGPHCVTDWHLIYGADLEWKPTDNRSLMFARYHGLKAIRTDREVDWKKMGE